MANSYVFDTSTLILLAKTTILRSFANKKKIIITSTVREEALRKQTDDSLIIQQLFKEKLMCSNNQKINATKIMDDFRIEKGEAECILFAREHNYSIATDDGPAIKACKILDLRFITAIHCIIYIYREKVLTRKIALEKLKNLERYGRYSTEIIHDAKNIIEGENHD